MLSRASFRSVKSVGSAWIAARSVSTTPQLNSRYVNDHNKEVWGTYETGTSLLHNPLYNKGTSYSYSERERMGLRGLVPPVPLSPEIQQKRVRDSLDKCKTSIQKYLYLISLMDRNETLFYHTVSTHIKELSPVIYTPTVGEACQRFSALYRRSRGMYFSSQDKGEMHCMVYNWPVNDVDVIVVTDGSRILGLGDLGCQGMGIPIGKLSLYVACGGVNPGNCLPIQLDFGTNNQELLNDPLYIGMRHERVSEDVFFELMDEFISAVTARWPHVFIQFEDFSSDKAQKLLDRFKHTHKVFNDDIQGTGAVAVSGVLGGLRVKKEDAKNIVDQRIVCLGGGSAGIGVVTALKNAMVAEGLSEEEAAEKFYIVDHGGLIGKSRALEDQALFGKPDDMDGKSLLEVVDMVKPTLLLGLSGVPKLFTEEVIRTMAKHVERPLIFPMSNPTSRCEATAEDVINWTDGKAIMSTGSPFEPVNYNGKTYNISQGNNMYIFPALGLMTIIAKPRIIPDSMLHVAAVTLSKSLTQEELDQGMVFPDLARIQEVSRAITKATCEHAYELGVATAPKPVDFDTAIDEEFYKPEYQPLVRMDMDQIQGSHGYDWSGN